MIDQSAKYLPCVVAVASFQPMSQAKIAISGASWWPYANVIDRSSNANLFISGAPLGLHNFNMTPENLTFEFSGSVDEGDAGNGECLSGTVAESGMQKHGPVIPTTFSLNLYVCCDGEKFSISLSNGFNGMAGFTFCDKLYPIIGAPVQIDWPKEV